MALAALIGGLPGLVGAVKAAQTTTTTPNTTTTTTTPKTTTTTPAPKTSNTSGTGVYGADRDIAAEMNQAIANGNYTLAAQLEAERNQKVGELGSTGQNQWNYLPTNMFPTQQPAPAPNLEIEDLRNEIRRMNEMAQEQASLKNQYATSQSVNEVQRMLQEKTPFYDQALAQNELSTRNNLDNLALRKAAMGDMGGIGQKQYSEAANAGDQRLLAINLERQNLENKVAQQVADLQAQGRFNEANIALEVGQQQTAQMIEEARRIQELSIQEEYNAAQMTGTFRGQPTLQAQEFALEQALQKLQLGMFTAQDALALGVPANEAATFAAQVMKIAQQNLPAAQKVLEEKVKSPQTAEPAAPQTAAPTGPDASIPTSEFQLPMQIENMVNNYKRGQAPRLPGSTLPTMGGLNGLEVGGNISLQQLQSALAMYGYTYDPVKDEVRPL